MTARAVPAGSSFGAGAVRSAPNLDLSSHPLLIDPEKAVVEVVQPKEFAVVASGFRVHDGNVYFVFWESQSYKKPLLVPRRIARPSPERLLNVVEGATVVFSGDMVHVVGKDWWSGKLSDAQLTRMGSVPWHQGTGPMTLDSVNESNHYGLLVNYWSKAPSGLEQVLFDKEAAAAVASKAPAQPASVPWSGETARRPEATFQEVAAAHPLTDRSIVAAKTLAPARSSFRTCKDHGSRSPSARTSAERRRSSRKAVA